MADHTPELGQIIRGNPCGEFAMPSYAGSLLEGVLGEIDRVYWNRNQKVWDRHDDPEVPGMQFQAYWWGDDDVPEAEKPNLAFGGVEIRWYKHPGRSMSTNKELTPAEWAAWHDACLAAITQTDAPANDEHCRITIHHTCGNCRHYPDEIMAVIKDTQCGHTKSPNRHMLNAQGYWRDACNEYELIEAVQYRRCMDCRHLPGKPPLGQEALCEKSEQKYHAWDTDGACDGLVTCDAFEPNCNAFEPYEPTLPEGQCCGKCRWDGWGQGISPSAGCGYVSRYDGRICADFESLQPAGKGPGNTCEDCQLSVDGICKAEGGNRPGYDATDCEHHEPRRNRRR